VGCRRIDKWRLFLSTQCRQICSHQKDVSVENAVIFQNEVEACLGNLNAQTLATYDAAITSGTSQFTSTVELNPDTQFVTLPIEAKVQLKDPGGTLISFRVPEESQEKIANELSGQVTLGSISGFEFDGYDSFTAQITSDEPGDGELRVSFNNNILSTIINRDDDDANTSIIENVQNFTFVGSGVRPGITGEPDAAQRRDETDIARNEG